MRLRVHPVKELYNGWNVQERRWWGWKNLSRFYSPERANDELQRMLKEPKMGLSEDDLTRRLRWIAAFFITFLALAFGLGALIF